VKVKPRHNGGWLSFLKKIVKPRPKKHYQVIRQVSADGKTISYHQPSESSPILYIEERLGDSVKVIVGLSGVAGENLNLTDYDDW
jgi:hypothetical protein